MFEMKQETMQDVSGSQLSLSFSLSVSFPEGLFWKGEDAYLIEDDL